ncbi:MAG: 3-alpha-hydroxysteroid dehydrogenase [Sphingomonadales bacterium]|nr:3-alpha-hydroxysteroid dehydrogenase [Sphingomonadales bacterium]
MAGRLNGRIAIITGGARGQGVATARVFASEGAKVVIADVLEAEGVAAAAQIGPSALFRRLDVVDEQAWNALVGEISDLWGTVDILVNNAGILHASTLLDLERKDFERVLDINLIGAWLGIKTTAPGMIAAGKGAIVNICSIGALCGMNGTGAYGASKWALRGLTKTAAMELGFKGVRVNAVFPGAVNTEMNDANRKPETEQERQIVTRPIQRYADPEEIARASLYLASDEASYLCGAEIVVDGGMTLGTYKDFLPGSPNA